MVHALRGLFYFDIDFFEHFDDVGLLLADVYEYVFQILILADQVVVAALEAHAEIVNYFLGDQKLIVHSVDLLLHTLKHVFSDHLKYVGSAGVTLGERYQVYLVVCHLFVVRLHVVQSVVTDGQHIFLVRILRTVLETLEQLRLLVEYFSKQK